MIRLSFVSYFSSCFDRKIWDTLQPRFAGQGRVKQTIFRAPFLAPSSWHGGKQSDPIGGCLDTYSLIAGPMCPVLDPAMVTTVNFFHGNVFYTARRAKLAWLLLARH